MTQPKGEPRRLFDEQVWEASDAEKRLELARQEPARFLWAADPEIVLADGPIEQLAEVLQPSLLEADLSVALRWLRNPAFLADDRAVDLLEARLDGAEEGAGWFALADGLAALRERGAVWKTARHLERLLDRFWLDGREADAVELVAVEFMDSALLATLLRHEPWRSDDARLAALVERCPTTDLARSLRTGFGLDRESTERLHLLLWATLARRGDSTAADASARFLAERFDQPIGRAGGTEVVLTLCKLHGDAVVEAMVGVFLSGAHRSPVGELLERWLLKRPEAALTAALDALPDWMPRFEPTAMERLSWRLLPRLDADARGRIRDLAEFAGGQRGSMVIEELDGLG